MGLRLAFHLLVERYDHLLQVGEREIDGFGLGEDYSFCHGARDAFRASEVDEVYLGVDLSERG